MGRCCNKIFLALQYPFRWSKRLFQQITGQHDNNDTSQKPDKKMDKTIYSLTIKAGETATLKVSDTPKVTDTLIELFKIDMETQKDNPQGNASLAGAEFTWKYYAGFYNKDNLPAEATRTWTTKTNPVNFKRIEDKDVDQNADVGGVSLIGNKDMKLDRNVLSGNLHIKEGRMITPEDKDMCVISEELAKQNNLKIGDKISFNDYHDTENSKVSEAEIVGIYQVDQKMSPLMQGDTYRSENVIFTDLRFPEKAEGETSPLYERAYFKVEDVEAYDEVKENLQKVDINWEQYDLIDNNGNSETMSSNFNDLAKVSEMMILVISVASFVILVLVFLFWLKNRVQEVGIFLSLGVPKFRIIGQIWSEAIMITVLSLMLSFAVAPAVSKVTANYLVSQQVQQMQEEEKNNEGKVSTEYVAPKQDVQSISVEVTPEMYLLDGVSVLVLITASVLVSGIVILKRNPKDILSEMS